MLRRHKPAALGPSGRNLIASRKRPFDPILKLASIAVGPGPDDPRLGATVLRSEPLAYEPVILPFDRNARNDLISDDTKARTRGVCCMSRCMSR